MSTCDQGKERSPVSGSCIKICPTSQTRSQTTGRCIHKTRKNRNTSLNDIPNIEIRNHEVFIDGVKRYLEKEGNFYHILEREENENENWSLNDWIGEPVSERIQKEIRDVLTEQERTNFERQKKESITLLTEQVKECTEHCKKLKTELEAIEKLDFSNKVRPYMLSKDAKLVDLLCERILDPSPDWKQRIDYLIHIPTSARKEDFQSQIDICRGGDYFEALFQLVFAIQAMSRFRGKFLRFYDIIQYKTIKNYEHKENLNYLYDKPVKNSGGSETGVSDITFEVLDFSDDHTKSYTKPYVCGDVYSVTEKGSSDRIRQFHCISIKGFNTEKALKGKYDIELIYTQIKNIKNIKDFGEAAFHIGVGVRDKAVFNDHKDRARIGFLADIVKDRVYGYDEIMSDFEGFRNQFFTRYPETVNNPADIRKKVEELFPPNKHQKPMLSLYFHQHLIAESVIARLSEEKRTDHQHTLCVGVLPRGGKSYICGGIINRLHTINHKPLQNVLFLTSAVNETLTQFKDDLIEYFADFSGYSFVDLRKDKPQNKDGNFIFVSRQYASLGKKTDDEEIDGGEIAGYEKLLSELRIKIDVVFFDEAHVGGSTEIIKTLYDKIFSRHQPPLILMTATYRKPALRLLKSKKDLFIWDLFDVQEMRKLGEMGFNSFIKMDPPNDILARFPKAKSILETYQQNGVSESGISGPYMRFPDPVFIHPLFNDDIKKHLEYTGTGYDITRAFKLNKIGDEIYDVRKWKTWSKFLVNGPSQSAALRDYCSGVFDSTYQPGSRALVEIDHHSQFHGTDRPRLLVNEPGTGKIGRPASLLMFLPTIKDQSIGHLCRAWGSFLLENKYWKDNFVILTLSPSPELKKKGVEYTRMNDEEDNDCVKRGLCVREYIAKEEHRTGLDLKTLIVEVERRALAQRKGLLILTGEVAKMGISLPCVDVVYLLDDGKEVDDIIQKMFRAMTDNAGKRYGYIVDPNMTRVVRALFTYDAEKDLQRPSKAPLRVEERLNKILEACDWGQNSFIQGNMKEFDYKDIMAKVKSVIVDLVRDEMYGETINDLKADFKEIRLNEMLEFQELFDILKHTDISKVQGITVAKALEIAKDIDLKPAKVHDNNSEASTKQPKELMKDEKKVQQAILEKMYNMIRTFINVLVLTQNSKLYTISDMMREFQKSKHQFITSGKSIECGCRTITECQSHTNLYESTVCSLKTYFDNDIKKTIAAIQNIENLFSHNAMFRERWNIYIQSLVAKVDGNKSALSVRMDGGGESSNSRSRYNKVLKVIDDYLIPDETAKKERGEVFTPPELVREMLFGLSKKALKEGKTVIWGFDSATETFVDADEDDRIGGLPTNVWRNPNLKWLDPANGIGNFPIIAFYKLDHELKKVPGYQDIDKRRVHIIEKMLFMIELDKGNVAVCRRLFSKIQPGAKPNICCADSLSMTNERLERMFGVSRFDIIMGNPPFNPPKTETGSSGNSIWQNFVIKSFNELNKNGILCFVHPPGWKKPIDETYNPDKFKDGVFKGQIRQGHVWQLLKDHGSFSFVYTNDQKDKTLTREYLNHFPSVDYYVYHKTDRKMLCDAKNVFLGRVLYTTGVKLNYNLPYLPNLITSQSQDILLKISQKEGNKMSFKADRKLAFGKSLFSEKSKGKYQYIYTVTKKGPVYAYSNIKVDNLEKDKIVMNYDGGIDAYYAKFIQGSEEIGSAHMSMYMNVSNNREGIHVEKFINCDIIKYVFLITQYASGQRTKNEPLVANSITIPPEDVTDYYEFFGIQKYKTHIEETLSQYETFKGPTQPANPKSKTRKAKKLEPKKGGSRYKTYRRRHRFV